MSFIQVDETDFDEVLNKEFDKGQIIILKFGSEYWFSSCGHLNSLKAKLHAFVLKGETIGEMG